MYSFRLWMCIMRQDELTVTKSRHDFETVNK